MTKLNRVQRKNGLPIQVLVVAAIGFMVFLSVRGERQIKNDHALIDEDKATMREKADTKKTNIVRRILTYRNAYYMRYNNARELLGLYEKNKYKLMIKNAGDDTIRATNCGIFYGIDRIREEIGINETDSAPEKAEKIFNFVKTKYKHALPLYKNEELYRPQSFFTVYGAGLCDNAASNMAVLARLYGFQSGVWMLKGHVVATVKYNEKWRIYDPDALGIVYYNNEVADMDEMLELAEQNKLGDYSNIYRTTEDNRHALIAGFLSDGTEDPYMEFFPGETRYFYDEAFIVSTDGSYLKHDLEDPDKFNSGHEGITANMVREIPLNKKTVLSGEITITDYFPFAGVYIRVPAIDNSIGRGGPYPNMYAEMFLDSERIKTDTWLPASIHKAADPGAYYLDLTLGLKNLERYPTYKIRIRKLAGLLEKYKDVKLITMHYFCYPNARFDDNSLGKITELGLVYEYGKENTENIEVE